MLNNTFIIPRSHNTAFPPVEPSINRLSLKHSGPHILSTAIAIVTIFALAIALALFRGWLWLNDSAFPFITWALDGVCKAILCYQEPVVESAPMAVPQAPIAEPLLIDGIAAVDWFRAKAALYCDHASFR